MQNLAIFPPDIKRVGPSSGNPDDPHHAGRMIFKNVAMEHPVAGIVGD
jgi:hypothetical protein